MIDWQRLRFLSKLSLPIVLVSLLTSTLLVLVLYYAGARLIEKQLRQRILDESSFLQYEYREDGIDELLEEIEERIEKSDQSWRYIYSVRAPNNQQVYDVLPHAIKPGWDRIDYKDELLIYTTELSEGYRLMVGLNIHDLLAFRKAFIKSIGWLLLISSGASLLLVALVYQRLASVLRVIGVPVQRFSEGNMKTRIPSVHGGPDLDQLALNLNTLFSQIENMVAQLRNLTANIAHDLRTPLTRAKNHLAESIQDGHVNRSHLHAAEDELNQVLTLFREILRLNEIQSGRLSLNFEKTDLTRLISKCVELYQPMFEDKNIYVEQSVPVDLYIDGNVHLLRQVFVNLIENTINHTSGCCDFFIRHSIKNGVRLFLIGNNGVAVKSDKKHFGLGLAFVDAIVRLHGGNASNEALPDGGFVTKISFPVK